MGDSFFEFGPTNGVEPMLHCDESSSDQSDLKFSSHFHEDSGYTSTLNGFHSEDADAIGDDVTNHGNQQGAVTSSKPKQNGHRNGVLKRGHRDSKHHHVTFSDEPEIVTSDAMTSLHEPQSNMAETSDDERAPVVAGGHFSILQLGDDGFPAYDVIAPVGAGGNVQSQNLITSKIVESPSPAPHLPLARRHPHTADTKTRHDDVTTSRHSFVTPIIRLKRWPR